MRSYVELFRIREFRRIVWGTLPGRMAYAMVGLAIFFNAKDLTGSLATAGLAVGANVFTSSVTAGLRGLSIDRFGQTKPLMILTPLYTATMLFLAFADPSARWLVILAGLNGVVAPPINLSARPLYRLAVGEERLRTAQAFDAMTQNLTFMLGPVVSAWLAVSFSPRTALVVTASFMLIGGAALLTNPLSRRWVGEPAHGGGLRNLLTPAIGLLLLDATFIGFGMGSFDIAVPSAASLAGHPERSAWLLGSFAVGSVIGGAWAGAKTSHIDAVRGAIITVGICASVMLLLPLTDPNLGMAAVALLGGIAIGPSQVFMIEVINLVRPPGMEVSAQGWLWSLEGGMVAVGSAVAGYVSQHHGSTPALVMVGCSMLVAPVTLWSLRHLLVAHPASVAAATV